MAIYIKHSIDLHEICTILCLEQTEYLTTYKS